MKRSIERLRRTKQHRNLCYLKTNEYVAVCKLYHGTSFTESCMVFFKKRIVLGNVDEKFG